MEMTGDARWESPTVSEKFSLETHPNKMHEQFEHLLDHH